MEIRCDVAINGIGIRSVKIAGPIVISFLDDKAEHYVTYESPRGFYMEDLNLGIFPSDQAEKIGWEFHVRELNPYFIADGHHVRESVLFIGTQFSILYTFMYSPA